MAKGKKGKARRRQKIPVAATVTMLIALKQTWDNRTKYNRVVQMWTGFNPGDHSWNIMQADALITAGAGAAASMVASKSGLNRHIKIPYLKI